MPPAEPSRVPQVALVSPHATGAGPGAAAQGTKVCGLTDKIFSGHILKFIECLNVDYKSEKKDMFQDIMVDVKGCKNVYDSFDRITAEDKFEGENQYDCEGHGKQVPAPCI